MGGVWVRANETSCWQAKSCPLTKNGRYIYVTMTYAKLKSFKKLPWLLSQTPKTPRKILIAFISKGKNYYI